MNDSIRSRQRVLESLHIRMAASLTLMSVISRARETGSSRTTLATRDRLAHSDSRTALGLEKIRQAIATARNENLPSREVVAVIRSWADAQMGRNHDSEAADAWNAIFREIGAEPSVALTEAARMHARYSKAAGSGCVGAPSRSVAWKIVA